MKVGFSQFPQGMRAAVACGCLAAIALIAVFANVDLPQSDYAKFLDTLGGRRLAVVAPSSWPPSTVVYPDSMGEYAVGEPVVIKPAVEGGTPNSFAVSPPLPSGITLNPTTGVISGTFANDESRSSLYTITATNAAGSASAQISFRVEPVAISYPGAASSFGAGQHVKLVPKIIGNPPTNYTIVPELLNGLQFDRATGIIEGTLDVDQESTVQAFIVTGRINAVETTSAEFLFEVGLSAPAQFSYSDDGVFDKCGSNSLAVQGSPGEVDSYLIVPALPPGLEIDSETGDVSGQLQKPFPNKGKFPYTITARNKAGARSASLTVEYKMPKSCGPNWPLYCIVGLVSLAVIGVIYNRCTQKQEKPIVYIPLPNPAPQPAPQPRPQGLKLTFDTGRGDWVPVYATRKPLGLIFEKHNPIRITDEKDSHGKEIGIKIGWTLMAINDVDITGKGFQEADEILHREVDKLPGGIPLTWDTGNSIETVWAYRKPLGLTFEKELPIKITREKEGHGKEIGIAPGWILKKINYKDISQEKSFETVDKLLHAELNRLPSIPQ